MLTFKKFYDIYKEDKEKVETSSDHYNIKLTNLYKIDVDCSDVASSSFIRISEKYCLGLIILHNCDKLDITIDIESEDHFVGIQICGNENSITTYHNSNVFINGNNNIIKGKNCCYLEVEGNNNTLSISGQAKGICISGKNNIINLYTSEYWQIKKGCIDCSIVAYAKSKFDNYSFSSSIFCFGRTLCRTVKCKKGETFGESVIYYLTEKTGKNWCREPIDDKCGYFYKAVSKDLTPLVYKRNNNIVYTPGTYVHPDSFILNEITCGQGIHFFGSIVEAIDFASNGLNTKEKEYKIVKLKVDFEDIAPIAQSNYYGKMRARKVYVDSIVPEEEYKDLKERFVICYAFT